MILVWTKPHVVRITEEARVTENPGNKRVRQNWKGCNFFSHIWLRHSTTPKIGSIGDDIRANQ